MPSVNVNPVGAKGVVAPPVVPSVNVNPVGAGDVQVNSITPSNYPYSGTYFGGLYILLKASDNPGYIFDHWEIFNNTLDSSTTNPNNSIQITQGDSVVAHYTLTGDIVELTFDVENSSSLTQNEKTLLKTKLHSKSSKENILVLFCDETRSQHRNKEIIIKLILSILLSVMRFCWKGTRKEMSMHYIIVLSEL